MKLPNDLIKATDYSKAKDREIHEFEYRNGKYIHKYVLGGEHELTPQEIIDCLNAISTIDCDLQTAYAYIQGQQKQIADLEAKLAERKEFCISQTQSLLDINNALIEENNELKQQLAEKDLELQQKNKLIVQENGECILCGDCYCINNDVRKIVEENKQLSQRQKQEIIWLKEFDGLFERGKDYEDVWQFLIDRIALVNGERYAD